MATKNIASASLGHRRNSQQTIGFPGSPTDSRQFVARFLQDTPGIRLGDGSWYPGDTPGSLPPVQPIQILYEDNHLLIVNKPAEWVVQGAQSDQQSLLEAARLYIKQKYQKPGKVYLGVVSRLDAPVTGVVPLARTSKAAARLSAQFRVRTPRKTYLAIVEGVPEQAIGELEHLLVREPNAITTRIARNTDRAPKKAILMYRRIRSRDGNSLLAIQLVTGRKHQIRCQLAAMGWPIVGDKLYGAHETFAKGIALHCSNTILEHPTTKVPLSTTAPLPSYWPTWTRHEDTQGPAINDAAT